MKLSCDVISDLLPLYAEDLATEASKTLVQEHLEGCESCRRKAEKMSAAIPIAAAPAVGMESVRREIVRRRWLAVGCAVLLLCALACGVLNWLTSPIYLDEAVITEITDNGDGTVTISMDAAAVGRNTFQFEIDPTEAGETFVIWTSPWLELTWSEPIPRPFSITRSVTHNGIYYFTGREGEEDLLIYENPQKFINGGVMTLPRLFLGFYFQAALGLGVVLLALALIFRRQRFAKYLAGAGSLALCYALCQGIVCGFTFQSFFAQQELGWAVGMAFCAWGAGLCAWKLRRKR